jgi:Kef-type K+ transport system membrane component KefB
MEDLVERLTRGNPTEVKVLLASVVLALAVYQLVLIAVGYGRLRPPFLQARPAARAHRAIGDALAALIVVVAVMCIAVYGWDDDGGAHAVLGAVLIGVLALKVLVVRRGGRLGRLLPLLGMSVFALLALTWLASAGDFLADG